MVKAHREDTHFTLRLVPLFWKIPPTRKEASASPWVPPRPTLSPGVLCGSFALSQEFCGALYSSRSRSTLLRKAAPTSLTVTALASPMISTMGQFSSCVALGENVQARELA